MTELVTYPPRHSFSSNEIHNIETVQNTIAMESDTYSYHLPNSFTLTFPPFLLRKASHAQIQSPLIFSTFSNQRIIVIIIYGNLQIVSELIATFLLVFVTCGAAALNGSNDGKVSQLGASIAGGLIVTVMIYSVGHISGAHMNPAVTLAFAVSKHGQFPWIQVILIIYGDCLTKKYF